MSDPILIIGGGPVGLSLGLALLRRGQPTLIFESQPDLGLEARASTFHPPTLEMFAEWGLADSVIEHGLRIDHLQYWERSTRELIADFDYKHIANDTRYPFRLQCPQSTVTRLIKPHVEPALHFNHRLVGFQPVDDHVAATFETPQGPKTMRGSFLCGCDGSKSTVRKQLGHSFAGETYTDRFLLISTDFDFDSIFKGVGPVAYIFDPEEWVILMRQRDGLRVVFKLDNTVDESEALMDAAIQRRFDRLMGKAVPIRIEGRSVYSVHRRIATSFREGRVILAGDAAHLNNPTGGMGMNSGIHDAHNLSDKLSRIGVGGDPDFLLDQYDTERRAAAIELVQQLSHRNSRDMNATDEVYRQQRNRQLRDDAADPQRARVFLLRASMLNQRI